jgi:hypothetical protein
VSDRYQTGQGVKQIPKQNRERKNKNKNTLFNMAVLFENALPFVPLSHYAKFKYGEHLL